MKLSARNVMEARVVHVKEGLVNAEIGLELPGGQKLASVISLGSAKSLGLQSGKTAYAIVKASNVMIAESCGKISARNTIACKVCAVRKGNVNAEITLQAGGQKLVSIITLESSENLGLTEGKQVYAIVKASDIIIGVTD